MIDFDDSDWENVAEAIRVREIGINAAGQYSIEGRPATLAEARRVAKRYLGRHWSRAASAAFTAALRAHRARLLQRKQI